MPDIRSCTSTLRRVVLEPPSDADLHAVGHADAAGRLAAGCSRSGERRRTARRRSEATARLCSSPRSSELEVDVAVVRPAQGIDLALHPQLAGEPARERGVDAGRQLPDGEGAGVHRATTVPGARRQTFLTTRGILAGRRASAGPDGSIKPAWCVDLETGRRRRSVIADRDQGDQSSARNAETTVPIRPCSRRWPPAHRTP